MLNEITFKTELSEILTIEEVAILFDTIKKKYDVELVSLSLYPTFNEIRQKFIKRTIEQRNKELSKLLTEIAKRKQEIKINIWQKLSIIESNKRSIQNNAEREKNLEQIIYEAEQIINVYEKSIKMLERKEKKVMTGKYSRVEKIKMTSRKRSLKKQLESLRERAIEISIQHDNCFQEFLDEVSSLIEKSIISNESFSKFKSSILTNTQTQNNSLVIEDHFDSKDENSMHYVRSHESKDFYSYEPNQEDPDDELIFQLLTQGKYDSEDGTINGLSLPQIFSDYEEA